MNVPFTVPEITINGKRQTKPLPKISVRLCRRIQLNRDSGSLQVKLDRNLLWVRRCAVLYGFGLIN